MSVVRLIQIDGKLPNLALMRLSAWHKKLGDDVQFSRSICHGLFESEPDIVYASSIFRFSAAKTARLLVQYPAAIVGGTGVSEQQPMEEFVPATFRGLDYSIYPEFHASIGFTQRGCRLKCKFCVVPAKEGKPQSVATIGDIWRGSGHARKLHLLDNDFFGQPEHQWRARISEIREGGFKVCLNQGINIRLIDDAIAAELAGIEYRDDGFRRKRLYTAWDNLKDEKVFFRGVDALEAAGVPPNHLMTYMLVGFDRSETWERIFYRFERMVQRDILPYPMVYDNRGHDGNDIPYEELKRFQRWAVTGLYRAVKFEDYAGGYRPRGHDQPFLIEPAMTHADAAE